MADHYRKGSASLQKAANQAEVSLYQMREYLEAEKIFPPFQSREEIQQDIRSSEHVFQKISNTQSSK